MAFDKTVLIVDDAAVNRRMLARILAPDYAVQEAENGQAALDILHERAPAISAVILDLVMPQMDGYAFLRAAREQGIDIPIIVATGNSGEQSEAEALMLGAWDFITKPYNADIIKFRLRGAIERSQLSALKQLKYMAEFDSLTGIFNKTKFFESTREMLAANPGRQFAFIRADINRFQLINSFFGTDEGDRLLIYLANTLRDNVYRLGMYTYGRIEADVFALCVAYTSKERVLCGIEESKEHVKAYNRSFDIVPTYGVYFLDDLTLPMGEMLDRAALAARTRKGNYMNNVGVYAPHMSRQLEQEQIIVNEMASALAGGQFIVYLQPKYDLESDAPAGAEALVRWQHPQKGLVPPGMFIPIFEKNGFIAQLDFHVWETVCALIRSWLEQGMEPAPISVNVSRANLYNPNIVQKIDALVRKYNVPPRLFQLELTESAYMDNPQMMEHFTESLHAKGFTILMDDFGSGYSSLSMLKNIRTDVLKIDMRFFEDATVNGRGQNIIASVVRMAKWLNIRTVAEGVEKVDQVNFLRSIGCDSVQGYYFARPMPVKDYVQLVRADAPSRAQGTELEGTLDVDRLWSTEPEMQILFSNAAQANCIYEFDGLTVEALRVNKAFMDLFENCTGASADNAMSFVMTQDRTDVMAAFQKCADEKKNAQCVYRRRMRAGDMSWVRLRLQYICQVGIKHIVLGHLTDITEQKCMEFELNRFHGAALSSREGGRKKLLIIDDSEISVSILRSIFQKDYQIISAGNGREGLELAQRYHDELALILLDMIMPVMDGMEFLSYKNDSADIAAIPVIVISADDDQEKQTSMLRLGVNDYIMKPFVAQAVERRVKNVLEYSGRFSSMVNEYKKAAAYSTQERLFDDQNVYTPEEIRRMILFLSPVFDIIRIVDPLKTAVITFDEDGRFKTGRYFCFDVWKKDKRCRNCSSAGGIRDNCRMTKYEFIRNNVFYVVSNHIVVQDSAGERKNLAFEIISRVSDHVMINGNDPRTMDQLIDETQKKIYTDELTGAYNRRYMAEMLFANAGHADEPGPLALVMLDLHGFKKINDTYGHLMGDTVLSRTAGALMDAVRPSDSVIRYGGDEFVVALTNCTREQAQSAVERLRAAVEAVTYGENQENMVEADLGYSYTRRFDFESDTVSRMISEADAAMYDGKNGPKAHPGGLRV